MSNIGTLKKEILPKIIKLRHYFHQHPELSNKEFKTSEKIIEILTDWGIPIVPTDLDTGLLAEIKGDFSGPTIVLRADLDALPVKELTELNFKSVNDGIMHACGHDLHFTSLLGAAFILNNQKDKIHGTVRLLFQPAEEAGHGGDQVLAKHVLDNVKAIVGFHNNPELPIGTIALQSGPMMAGCYHIGVKINGIGSHAAQPEKSQDVIFTQAIIISQLQSIVSRNSNPFHPVVLSITKVRAGHTWNVLPETASFEGTVRTFSKEDAKLVKSRFYNLVENISKAYGQTVEITWTLGAYPIKNDTQITKVVANGLSRKVIKPTLSMTGEDFATFENQIPGTFAFIGSNGNPKAANLHDSHYVGSDQTISTAIDYFVESATSLLDHFQQEDLVCRRGFNDIHQSKKSVSEVWQQASTEEN
ncbi:amidohydrolase [Companilactobacillus farciminis]|nr:amidohydrolase [Companilactobacillus farciminis]